MSLTRSQSLEAALLANGPVGSLVGSRIYPLLGLPSNSAPQLIYKFTVDYKYTTGGPNRVEAQPLEIRSWASDYDVAHALADAVQAVLMPAGQAKGFHGKLGGATGVNVIHCLLDREEENRVAVTPDQFAFEVCSYYHLVYTL